MKYALTVLAAMTATLTLSGCDLLPTNLFSWSTGKTVTVEASDTDGRYAEGKAHLAADRLGLALSTFQRAHFEAPADPRIVNALAVTYDRLQRFDLAQRYYRQALALDGGAASTLNNYGYSLLLAGEFKKAAETLAQAYERGVEMPEAEIIRANIALLRQRVGPENVGHHGASKSPSDGTPTVRLVQAGTNSHDLLTGSTRTPVAPLLRPALPPRKPEVAASSSIAREASAKSGQTRIAEAPVVPLLRPALPPRKPKIASSSSIAPELSAKGGQTQIAEAPVEPLLRPALPPRKPEAAASRSMAPELSVKDSQTRTTKPLVEPLLRPLTPPRKPEVASTNSITLEVSNGTTRHHLAQRVSKYLAGHGYWTLRWTNALGSDHSISAIFYRTGEEDKARAIAALLPFDVKMYPVPGLRVEVKVLLGDDSLPFDKKLTASASDHHSEGKNQT